MRWKTNRPRYEEGAVRTREKYAWLPTRIEDYTVWLEFYNVKEKLVAVVEFDEFANPHRSLQWQVTERHLLDYYP